MKQIPIPAGGMLYEGNNAQDAVFWFHGLNGTYNTQGMGKQMAQGLEVPKLDVYSYQNPNQADWSKNETNACYSFAKARKKYRTINVFGWSQGGQSVATCLNFHKEEIYCAGMISGWTGMTNYADFVGIHFKAWHGDKDETRRIENVIKFVDGLKKAGVDADMIIYNGKGHNIVDSACNINDPDSTWQWLDSKLKLLDVAVPPQPTKEAIIEQYFDGVNIVFVTDKGNILKVKPE